MPDKEVQVAVILGVRVGREPDGVGVGGLGVTEGLGVGVGVCDGLAVADSEDRVNWVREKEEPVASVGLGETVGGDPLSDGLGLRVRVRVKETVTTRLALPDQVRDQVAVKLRLRVFDGPGLAESDGERLTVAVGGLSVGLSVLVLVYVRLGGVAVKVDGDKLGLGLTECVNDAVCVGASVGVRVGLRVGVAVLEGL